MSKVKEKGGAEEQQLPYEAVIEKLDEVVQRLEAGDLPLEESLRIFERGIELSKEAQRQLDAAEHRVEILLQSGRSEAFPPAEEGEAPDFDEEIPY